MKPRDVLGNDLIVPCTAIAMMIATEEGRYEDREYVRYLSFKLYGDELKRLKDGQ